MILKFHERYLNIGVLLLYKDSLTDVILTAIDLGIYTMMITLGNSRNFTRKRIDTEDLVTSIKIITTHFPTILFSYIPNMYNLCGSRSVMAWNGNEHQDEKTTNIIKEIEYELTTMAKLGGSSMIELGSYRHSNEGISTVIKSINNIKFKLGCRLILMNSIDNFFNVGITLQHLSRVYEGVDKHAKQYLSIGLNIAYLFVNGIYDFRDPEEVSRLFRDYLNIFQNKFALCVIILSDCVNDFNSKDYTYESIGTGKIWKDNESSLYRLLEECQTYNISVITNETHDMELLRELINL
jgi:endonuclease IV